jgi:hypothetical protein
VNEADANRLRAALRARKRAELKRIFALVRGHDDGALLAAIAPAKRLAPPRRDALGRELEQILKPILGPASEKADLLVGHMARRHRRKLAIAPNGLADAARRLRGSFSDDEIRAGAKSLVAHLARRHGRETVV